MLWSLLGALPLVRGVLPTCASLTVVSHIRERLSGRFGRVDGGYGGVKVGIRGEVWAGARGPRGLERGARRVGRGRAVCPPSPGSVPLRGCRVRPSGPSAAVTSPESGFLCVPWVRLRCRLVTPAAGGRGSLPAGEQSPLRPHPPPPPPTPRRSCSSPPDFVTVPLLLCHWAASGLVRAGVAGGLTQGRLPCPAVPARAPLGHSPVGPPAGSLQLALCFDGHRGISVECSFTRH